MNVRTTRNEPFCWQSKKALRLLRSTFKGAELVKMITLYQTLTMIYSDTLSSEIKHYTNTIASYSGLFEDFIPRGIKSLESLGIIKVEIVRKAGRFDEKVIHLLDGEEIEKPQKTVTGQTATGRNGTGQTGIYKKKPSEEEVTEEDSDHIIAPSLDDASGGEVNQVFKVFYDSVNPAIKYNNKTTRADAKFLIEKFGLKETLAIARYAVSVQGKPYSPTITNPSQLRDRLGSLRVYLDREKSAPSITFIPNL